MRIAVLAVSLVVVGSAFAATPRGTPGPDRIDTVNGARDVVRCGAGRDIVAADLKDVVARDCEIVSRRIALDVTTTAGAQHRSIVEPSAVGDGTTLVSVFQSGRIEDGGAAAIGWSTSLDGGLTWRRDLLPDSGAARVSDPVVARDRTHGVWIAAVLALFPDATRLLTYSSPDGVTWSAPVVAAVAPPPPRQPIAYDKEWIGCDNRPASPHAGSCYLAYTDLTTDNGELQTSHDGGATWGAAVPLKPAGGEFEGAIPVVEPSGALVVVYAGDRGEIDAVTSADGGGTFAPPVRIATVLSRRTPLRVPPLPSAAETTAGVRVVWPDCSAHPGCAANDILTTDSADGATWSAPRVAVSGGDYVDPAIGAAGDAAAVVAYTRLPGPCCRLGVRMIRSSDGGATWGSPIRLDAQPMDTTWLARAFDGNDSVAFLGDYMAVAFAGSRPIPVYAAAHAPANGLLRQDLFAATRLP